MLANGKIRSYLFCFQVVYEATANDNAFRVLFLDYVLHHDQADVDKKVSAHNPRSLSKALSRTPIVTFYAIREVLDLGRSEIPPRP